MQDASSQPATRSESAPGNQDGATAIRYALIASGIGATVAATVYSLGASGATFAESVANLF
jgi:Flp pilus assembly pilin Flp